mmetsp:Transcript_60498/g.124527  ORF Transcript_60498/g.124527 Transcript_60498/m.124527 type:complete len:211 (+) Transcript_60498:2843-3475(+)
MLLNPKIFITTSRFPSPPLMKFVKELCVVFPNSKKINRGGKFLPSLVTACLFQKATDIFFVYENRGKPATLVISHFPNGPSVFFSLSNVVFQKKQMYKKIPKITPHVIFNNLESNFGKRISNIFNCLFPQPDFKSRRVVTFSGRGKFIIFNHHWFEKNGITIKNILLRKIGPSFYMYPFKIVLGILGETESEVEWVATPFLNTFKKKNFF